MHRFDSWRAAEDDDHCDDNKGTGIWGLYGHSFQEAHKLVGTLGFSLMLSTEWTFSSGTLSKNLVLILRNRSTERFERCGFLIITKKVIIDWISHGTLFRFLWRKGGFFVGGAVDFISKCFFANHGDIKIYEHAAGSIPEDYVRFC